MRAPRKIWVTKPGGLEEFAQFCVITQHKGKNERDEHLSGNDVRTFVLGDEADAR